VDWIRNKDLAGGQIVDQAIHFIDLFRYLCAEIKEIYSNYTLNVKKNVKDFNNWDGYSVTFRFKNNAVGSLSTTYALFPEVEKEDGCGIDIISDELLIRYRIEKVEIITKEKKRHII